MFLSVQCVHANLDLAGELLAEGDFINARSEAVRSAPATDDQKLIQLHVLAVTGLKLNGDVSNAVSAVTALRDASNSKNLSAPALYTLGRALLNAGKTDEAVTALTAAFQCATDRQIFLKAACSLKQISGLGFQMSAALQQQIDTTRSEWTAAIWNETALPKQPAKGFSPGRWLGQGIVSFYRTQIRPVIGRRCSVNPSCSEYFLLAVRAHGVLGFPIQADRFYREPDIVMKHKKPVQIGNVILYGDPLADHDFWLRGKK